MDLANAFVLDGSVTMVWGFADEDDAYATSILKQMPSSAAHVPGIWSLEVANTLVMGERRGRVGRDEVLQFLALLDSFSISVDAETTARAWHTIMDLARSQGLTAYDAAYLELAIRLNLPLASLDAKLKRAAGASGVPLFNIV